jgi:predicted DNA-binding transcriptional regulator YafY
MAQTAARLLTLLSLFQARRAWSAADLADRLGVGERTVRRDVDALRGLGYPVHSGKGPGAGYRLGAGNRLPPLVLDDEQAVAVAVALQTAPSSVLGLGEAAERALATLREVMPAHLRHQVDALEVTVIRNPADLPAPVVPQETLVAVGAAVRRRQVLRFHQAPADVTTGLEPAEPERVEPHHLVLRLARWYLVAYDLVGGRWQIYRLDRVVRPEATTQTFTPRALPGPSVARHVMDQFDRGDVRDRWPCYGEAVLQLPARTVARWAPGGAVVEPVTDTTCRLTLGAWSWVGLAALLGTFDADLEVVGPPELLVAVDRLGERYRRSLDP